MGKEVHFFLSPQLFFFFKKGIFLYTSRSYILQVAVCLQRSAKVQRRINDCYFKGVPRKPCPFLHRVDGFTAVAEF